MKILIKRATSSQQRIIRTGLALVLSVLSYSTLANTLFDNAAPITDLSGASGSSKYFSLDVEAGATNLNFTTWGGSGDVDLYVKFGSQPTANDYDCRPYISGNEEVCSISNIQTGTYHIMIQGYSNYNGVSLMAVFNEGDTPSIPGQVIGVQNSAAAGDSITRAFAADCTYNTTFWGLLCPAGGDQPHHSWFDGSSANVNSVFDRYKALDSSINANKDAATTGAEMVGLREDGPEPKFAAQAEIIVAQSPAPDHVEFIFGGNDICSRDCI